jgi:hypothetical protein
LFGRLKPLVQILVYINQTGIESNFWNQFQNLNQNLYFSRTKPQTRFMVPFMCGSNNSTTTKIFEKKN